jgi:hypothetical protein
VRFQLNGLNSGSFVPLTASDTAAFSTTEPASGSFKVTAIYSGDQDFTGSPSAAFTEGVFGPGIFPVGRRSEVRKPGREDGNRNALSSQESLSPKN